MHNSMFDEIAYVEISHFHAARSLSFTVLFAMTAAVALSQCMGVGGCGWPSSSSVILMIFAYFAFKNIAPNSSSAVDAATNLRIVQSVRNGPFRQMGQSSSGSQTRKK